jgi:hypothetical protein
LKQVFGPPVLEHVHDVQADVFDYIEQMQQDEWTPPVDASFLAREPWLFLVSDPAEVIRGMKPVLTFVHLLD